ncbi:bifunctional oligoribonuclease/PAP phosphatase NrnA [Eubacteriaceae bacterium ES3]|nr:bifunctional oligoribonuclease/PAP phosphatase NrnA [Eubacteriaceae bacterium ES3]
MMKRIPEDVLLCLNENHRFLILLHQKPDGDAIGSAITMGKGLKSLGKEVDYYIETPVEEKLQFFDEVKFFNEKLDDHYDVVLILDCSTMAYCYLPELMPTYKTLLVIDHHKSNLGYGDLNFLEITGATAELVFRVVKALDANFDEEMADATFTGISTDTGSFQFSNVTSETHLILSYLYELKDNYSALSKILHHEKNIDQMKMTGAAIKSLEILDGLPIAFMLLDYNTISRYGGLINISDDIANIGQNTIGVAMTALLKEVKPGEYRVSLRARYPYDIHEIAVKYGGGGHERAAGFNYNGDIQNIKQELMVMYQSQCDKDV